MKKKSIFLILILFLMFFLDFIPISYCAKSTIQINLGSDDVFMTETYSLFKDTFLIKLKDPNVGIQVGLRFNNIPISRWDIVNEAILSVYTNIDYENETGLMATIYGFDVNNLGTFNESGDMSQPLTSYFYNWNISGVEGLDKWHNVTVTGIIKEITNRYEWEKYNSLGFKIMSVQGSMRTFNGYESDPSLSAKLYLEYDVSPVKAGYVFEESYKGYEIYKKKATGYLEGVPASKITTISVTDQSQHPLGLNPYQRKILFDNGFHHIGYWDNPNQDIIHEFSDNGTYWDNSPTTLLDESEIIDRWMLDLGSDHILDIMYHTTEHKWRRGSLQTDGSISWLAGWQDDPISWGYNHYIEQDSLNYPLSSWNPDFESDQNVKKADRTDGIWTTSDDDWNEKPFDNTGCKSVMVLGLSGQDVYAIESDPSNDARGRLRDSVSGWGSQEIIEDDGVVANLISVTVTPTLDIWVSYCKSGDFKGYLRYRDYSSGTWSDRIHLTYFTGYLYPEIVSDKSGYIYVVWYNSTIDKIVWLMTKDKGVTWINQSGGSNPQEEFSETNIWEMGTGSDHKCLMTFFQQYDDYIGVAWVHDTGTSNKDVYYGCINNDYFLCYAVFLGDDLVQECFSTLEDAKTFIDNLLIGEYPEDPLDFPEAGSGIWFTRARTKLMFLIAGFCMIFIPLWSMGNKRPDLFRLLSFGVIMIIGLSFLIHVGQI